jgi:hypothetical protein
MQTCEQPDSGGKLTTTKHKTQTPRFGGIPFLRTKCIQALPASIRRNITPEEAGTYDPSVAKKEGARVSRRDEKAG